MRGLDARSCQRANCSSGSARQPTRAGRPAAADRQDLGAGSPAVSRRRRRARRRLNEIVALAQPGTWRQAQRALEDWNARGRTVLR